jgi:hypothetical protein
VSESQSLSRQNAHQQTVVAVCLKNTEGRAAGGVLRLTRATSDSSYWCCTLRGAGARGGGGVVVFNADTPANNKSALYKS